MKRAPKMPGDLLVQCGRWEEVRGKVGALRAVRHMAPTEPYQLRARTCTSSGMPVTLHMLVAGIARRRETNAGRTTTAAQRIEEARKALDSALSRQTQHAAEAEAFEAWAATVEGQVKP